MRTEMSSDDERRARAQARSQRAWLRRTDLADAAPDRDPIFGAPAVALASRLSRESWLLSGRPLPAYTRSEIPHRFVRQRPP
jgi:hypothetical protein